MSRDASNPAGPPISENEIRLLSVIESAMDAIITVDEAQRVLLFNAAAVRIFGVPAAEALGGPLDRFIPERHRRSHAGHVQSFGQDGATMRAMGRLGVLSGLRADGTEFPIEASISQALVDGRRLFTVILRDVSERKKLEEQYLQAQKMEIIGRLAGGIAHDFNNLLMAIFNYLTLATKALEPGHPSRAALLHVQEASNRAATLTRQLLTFARKQVAKPRVVSPREIVAGFEPMLRRLISEDVILHATLPADTGNVRADPTQLEQVLMNLVVNARDAMARGGTLTIETSNVELDQHACLGVDGAAPGSYVAMTVTDTGSGMTPDIISRLFEPFFTTKEPGKGTGLGLATCHGIVRQCGGHISVKSAAGTGTTMRVMLPRVDAQAGSADVAHRPESPARGSETVLLAENADIVRDLIADALRSSGYTVLAASGSAEALRHADSHLGRIHLLVTDLMMPGGSGVQLAEALMQKRGRLPVLYISGGAQDSALYRESGQKDVAIMTKPFATDTLLARIRLMLDQAAGR